jgi:hypothetical protein
LKCVFAPVIATFIVWISQSMTYSWLLLIVLVGVLADRVGRPGRAETESPSVPTLGPGASSNPCTYTRTAPTVTGVSDVMDYDNTVTADSAQTTPISTSASIAGT